MWSIEGQRQSYAWGSPSVLPEFLGRESDGAPFAELWFGAHPIAPAQVETDAGWQPLDRMIADRPRRILGDASLRRFGATLPYLLKMIAPAQPLSLQVHPSLDLARESFDAEEAAGVPLSADGRNYHDANHKPEMVYALTRFEALSGFRTPRRAASILEGLGTDLTDRLHALLIEQPNANGMRAAFRALFSPHLADAQNVVERVAAACAERLASGKSPSPRIDAVVGSLHAHYPGDTGVLAALLLNPVTLNPGEAMFVPAGAVHCYLSGLGVEIMANSDNVLRAGLTKKRVDTEEMLRCVSCVAAPPVRIAPEKVTDATEVFYVPVDDFELSVTTLADPPGMFQPHERIPGSGARILLALDGEVMVQTDLGRRRLRSGQAVLVSTEDGSVSVGGNGRLVQASVA
ncbi:mannose-6-phosphate isomerase, class I [Dermabacteraceae bacterium P13264]